jgi:adenylylsulfate kinase
MAWVVWITGRPGSGKSTISIALKQRVPDIVILRSDELRRFLTPEPKYTEEEREFVYRALIYTARSIYELGYNVVIDATGNRRRWRDLARETIPHFYEVYIRCPEDVCIKREKIRKNTHSAPERIYEKALSGAPVPGINVPYEEPLKPDLIIDSERESPEQAADKIIKMVR